MRILTVFVHALLVITALIAGLSLFALGFQTGADFTKRQVQAKRYGEK